MTRPKKRAAKEEAVPVPNDEAPHSRSRGFATVAAIAILLSLAVKLAVLNFPHDEVDEEIYWQLTSGWLKTGHYTLRGTEVLKSVSPGIYDHPLFHHPPLFSVLLAPFVKAEDRRAAAALPWAGHLLAIGAVAWIVRRVALARSTPPTPFSLAAIVPIFGIALDPILVFLSRRLWMDSLLAGFAALAVALAFEAVSSERRRSALFAFSGLALAAGALLKLVALLALLPVALLIILRVEERKERLRALALVAAPIALLVGPWLVVFFREYGTIYPSWIAPDADSLARFPFVRATVERPFFYYLKELALAQPLVLVLAALLVTRARRAPRPETLALGGWAALSLAALSVLGATGTGFQMRYLCPMLPALYALLFVLFEPGEGETSTWPLIALAAVVYAGIGGAVNLTSLISDDFVSLIELAGRLKG